MIAIGAKFHFQCPGRCRNQIRSFITDNKNIEKNMDSKIEERTAFGNIVQIPLNTDRSLN